MANEKIFQSRIQLKHDIEENWSKATNFIPKVGEIIIYDIDENNSIARFKIGDGITNINSLPFVSHHEVISYLPQELTEEQKKQARDNISAADVSVEEKVETKLPSPESATVGQFIKVLELDDAGKITATEAVDEPDEDDALELVAELGIAEPMTDDEGKILTDENGALFTL